uniref:Uncharacterized protein n=1 Tax=Anguilla anguilla TaxID=7936 RepID=A0A0E9VA49_ANGAN
MPLPREQNSSVITHNSMGLTRAKVRGRV